MSDNKLPIVEQMLAAIEVALKQFGEYTYLDKGPGEVMDVDMYVEVVGKMSPDEVADSLIRLAETSQYGAALASAILMDLQHWDELFENEEVAELL